MGLASRSVRGAALFLAPALAAACGAGASPPPANPPGHDSHGHQPHATTTNRSSGAPSDVDARLAEVARIHGGAGPWAVAGFRMGEHALRSLGLPRGSFDLEVVHHSPREVQYACIADGASAATGASLGKLNLSIEGAAAPETRTVYRRRSTQQSITLRVSKAFAARFVDVPREHLGAAGREAMVLPDADVFEVLP